MSYNFTRSTALLTTAVVSLVLSVFSSAIAQPLKRGEQFNVALFVTNGAELLDFAGPGEVFSQAPGFNVFIIGLTEEPFTSQGFAKITPNFVYRNCPPPDILLIPGGGTSNLIKNPEALAWIREQSERSIILTVCTGAAVAAKAGLLEGRKATTYHTAFEYVGGFCEDCELLPGARWVDNGRIITTAGISAGIDGALHLVARLRGRDVATATARSMEYDKWAAGEGVLNYVNPFIAAIEAQGLKKAIKSYHDQLQAGENLCYPGELNNLAAGFVEAGDFEKAIDILEFNREQHPYELAVYDQLSALYARQGQYAPPSRDEFIDMLLHDKVAEGIAVYEKVKKEYPYWVLFEESAVNWVGYALLNRQKNEEAIEVFELNVREYPDSFNVFDSLGEACLKAGRQEEAKKHLARSLELNPQNKHAEELLAEIN